MREGLISGITFRSMVPSGKLPTYPSPNLIFALTSFFGQNVRFAEG